MTEEPFAGNYMTSVLKNTCCDLPASIILLVEVDLDRAVRELVPLTGPLTPSSLLPLNTMRARITASTFHFDTVFSFPLPVPYLCQCTKSYK